MKKFLGKRLGHPRVIYLALSAVAVFLTLFVGLSLLDLDSAVYVFIRFILIFGAIFCGWLAWLSHILWVRQSIKRLRDDVNQRLLKSERGVYQATTRMSRAIDEAQTQHVKEYEKQAYNLLIGIQELRIAVLNEKEPNLDDD